MLVPVYSLAKVFTAAAALHTFDLHERIGALATVPTRLAHLGLGDLLSHRSGLGDYGGWPEYRQAVEAREPAWPDERILERVELGPRGGFRYSNPGYLLVRRALESRYDATLFEVLTRLVFDPNEMVAHPFDTVADWEGCATSRVADVRRYDPAWAYPGTFVSDAASLERGLLGVLRSDVAPAMLEALPVDAPGHPFAEPGYGRGLMTSGLPPRWAGHGGGGPGFTLFALAAADASRAHVAFENDEVADEALIRECLASLS
ncbi:serine hydrolase domain-containing protein [soil metagenome]